MLEHQRCQRAALLVPGERLGKVDVRDAIARKHAEGFCEHVLRLFHAARRAKRLPLRVIAQRNPQRFAIAKSVLDAVGQIAQGDAHVCYAVRLQVQERVFQDGLVQKTNHGLGTVACERPQPRTFAAGHDDGFHPVSLQKNTILLCCNIVSIGAENYSRDSRIIQSDNKKCEKVLSLRRARRWNAAQGIGGTR